MASEGADENEKMAEISQLCTRWVQDSSVHSHSLTYSRFLMNLHLIVI